MADERRMYEEEGIYTPDMMEEDAAAQEAARGALGGEDWEIQANKLGAIDATTAFHCKTALYTAREDLTDCPYPESISDTVDYLGVDPKGKNCKEDMDFAHRMQRIESKAQLLTPAHQQLISGMKEDLNKAGSTLQNHFIDVRAAGEDKKIYARAAKRTTNPQAREALSTVAENAGNEIYAKQNLMLEALEYTMGIRKEPLTMAHDAMARGLLHMKPDQTKNLAEYATTHVTKQPTEPINIDFKNFDSTLAQRFMAHPSNHGKRMDQVPTDYKNPAVAQANVTAYARATVAPTLDAMFQEVDARQSFSDDPNSINRGNLIIVNGKSVAERMAETYQSIQGEKPEYKDWYKDNMKDMTNELVGMALSSNGSVAAFIPDSHGRIQSEPVPIQKTGYEPSPLKPVTMRGWHRAWNKVGLYKDRKIAFDNYQAELQHRAEADQAMKDAVTRAHTVNRVGQTIDETNNVQDNEIYYGGAVLGDGPPIRGFRTFRQCAYTGARAIMLGQGYSVEDVFDTSKLLEEKRAAGAEYLRRGENITPEVTAAMGQDYAIATEKMIRYMDAVHENMDINEAVNHPDYARHVAISNCCFDMSQETEMEEMQRAMVEYGRDPQAEPLTDQQVETIRNEKYGNPLNSYPGYYRFLSEGEQSMVSLYQGTGNNYSDFLEVVANNMFRDASAESMDAKRAANPDKQLSQLVGGTISAGIGTNSRQIATEVAGMIATTREEQKQFAMNSMSGAMKGKWCGPNKDFAEMKTDNQTFNILNPAFDNVMKNNLIKDNCVAKKVTVEAQKKSSRTQTDFKTLSGENKKEAPKHQSKKPAAPQPSMQKGGRGI